MTDIRKRFAYATELRGYADEVDALVLASNRDPEAPVLAKVDLAQRMRRRANQVMRQDETVERGRITADTLFTPRGPVRVDVRKARPRVPGTLAMPRAA